MVVLKAVLAAEQVVVVLKAVLAAEQVAVVLVGVGEELEGCLFFDHWGGRVSCQTSAPLENH